MVVAAFVCRRDDQLVAARGVTLRRVEIRAPAVFAVNAVDGASGRDQPGSRSHRVKTDRADNNASIHVGVGVTVDLDPEIPLRRHPAAGRTVGGGARVSAGGVVDAGHCVLLRLVEHV